MRQAGEASKDRPEGRIFSVACRKKRNGSRVNLQIDSCIRNRKYEVNDFKRWPCMKISLTVFFITVTQISRKCDSLLPPCSMPHPDEPFHFGTIAWQAHHLPADRRPAEGTAAIFFPHRHNNLTVRHGLLPGASRARIPGRQDHP